MRPCDDRVGILAGQILYGDVKTVLLKPGQHVIVAPFTYLAKTVKAFFQLFICLVREKSQNMDLCSLVDTGKLHARDQFQAQRRGG